MPTQPLIFIGHGSPMNAIEHNVYTESWREIESMISSRPRAILMLSAHWITRGETLISSGSHPEMIYDMYGFPPPLYRVRYDASGSPEIAEEIRSILEGQDINATLDPHRGLDHGAWSTLIHMFPEADIPVICMSLDIDMSPADLIELGRSLTILRDSGILIIGSGNIVHNLGALDWSGCITHDWASIFDERIATLIASHDIHELSRVSEWGDITRLAHPSLDHLLPLFVLAGASSIEDDVRFFTPSIVMGSLSMRSILWDKK